MKRAFKNLLVDLFDPEPVPFDESRGSILRGARYVQRDAKRAFSDGAMPCAWFGGMPMTRSAMTESTVFLGALGSGKTIRFKNLIRDALANAPHVADWRLLANDPKRELVPFLAAHRQSPSDAGQSTPRILIANPYDARCVKWDIYADIVRDPGAFAPQFAQGLVPLPTTGDRFFAEGAQSLLAAVAESFARRALRFSARDLLNAAQSPKVLFDVCRACAETAHIPDQIAEKRSGLESIFSTLAVATRKLRPIAAIWETVSETFSLWDFVTGRDILVLGADPSRAAVLAPLNAAIFETAVRMMLSRPVSFEREAWILLDELALTGRLPSLATDLLPSGREFGCITALGYQSHVNLRSAYGDKVADSVLGLCGNRCFLRLTCPTTADVASGHFGEFEYAVARQTRKRTLVMPSELLSMPGTTVENGSPGFFTSAALSSSWFLNLQHSAWPSRTFSPAHLEKYPAFLPREDTATLSLRPWTDEDLRRLALLQEASTDERKDALQEIHARLLELQDQRQETLHAPDSYHSAEDPPSSRVGID